MELLLLFLIYIKANSLSMRNKISFNNIYKAKTCRLFLYFNTCLLPYHYLMAGGRNKACFPKVTSGTTTFHFKSKHQALYLMQILSLKWLFLLCLAWMELIFFTVAHMVLCFRFVTTAMLIVHWCFSCCRAVLAASRLPLFLSPPSSE